MRGLVSFIFVIGSFFLLQDRLKRKKLLKEARDDDAKFEKILADKKSKAAASSNEQSTSK